MVSCLELCNCLSFSVSTCLAVCYIYRSLLHLSTSLFDCFPSSWVVPTAVLSLHKQACSYTSSLVATLAVLQLYSQHLPFCPVPIPAHRESEVALPNERKAGSLRLSAESGGVRMAAPPTSVGGETCNRLPERSRANGGGVKVASGRK